MHLEIDVDCALENEMLIMYFFFYACLSICLFIFIITCCSSKVLY